METFHLIIAGGSDFSDYSLLKEKVDELLAKRKGNFEVVIVSDTSEGAGMLGERYAAEMGYEVAEFPAMQDQGRVSVIVRHKQMGTIGDACICFWDGRSTVSGHLIATVKKAGLEMTIIPYS